ncbi:HD domain-containing protein [Tyzzerella sp. OttesenSCG-928-J15]|nr:HD domain-containing protein [Tyzzerella sp. OttesenSCG-928-J15]
MEYKKVTFEEVKNSLEFNTYIKRGNDLLGIAGFTDHSTGHTAKVGQAASEILTKLGYSEREAELAQIAGYVHDIGNMVNRIDHAQTGALMAFSTLTAMGMHPEEIATVVSAIGNHDESTGSAVNPVSAALIIADKTDVRRSRVRNTDFATFDIHDRVNYAVEEALLKIEIKKTKNIIRLVMKIDKNICPVMDYFEIFLGRMLMCKGAAKFLNSEFQLNINEAKIL